MNVDIIELIAVIRKNFIKAGILGVLAAALLVGFSFLTPPKYASTSKLIIKPKANNPGIVLQQLSPFMDFFGGNTSTNYIISVLESDTYAMKVIEKLDLANDKSFMKNPEKEKEKLIKAFKEKVTITKSIKDEIVIRAETLSPELSASIANTLVTTYLDEQRQEADSQLSLIQKLKTNYENESKELEQKMIDFQLDHKDLMIAGTQAENLINMIADTYSRKLMSEITVDQLEKAGASSGSPIVSSELKMELLKKKAETESYDKILNQQEDMLKSMPQTIQEMAGLKKQLVFNEQMLAAIAVRYHSTKINQQLDDSQIKIVDEAYPIHKKVKPKRSKYAILGFLLAFMLFNFKLISDNSSKIFIPDIQR